jgi:hypothetical protein
MGISFNLITSFGCLLSHAASAIPRYYHFEQRLGRGYLDSVYTMSIDIWLCGKTVVCEMAGTLTLDLIVYILVLDVFLPQFTKPHIYLPIHPNTFKPLTPFK